jgi:uncharacterized repeat protein (TIGR02543 family)/uncharacterized repeat protein (TIGR01451 family)
MKRILAIILTVILVLSSFTFAFANGQGAFNLEKTTINDIDLEQGECKTVSITISGTGNNNQQSGDYKITYPSKIEITSNGVNVVESKTYDFYNQDKSFTYDLEICALSDSNSINIDLFDGLNPQVPDGQDGTFISLGDRVGLQGNAKAEIDITVTEEPDPEPTYYTVRFIDHDDEVLKTEEVLEGDDATAPAENPTRDGYTFTGWDKDFTNIQSNLDVYAEYSENSDLDTYYTVRFFDQDETLLKTEQVKAGDDATAPSDPSRDGYTFTGWDKDFTNVQSDLNVYAEYSEDTVINPDPIYYTVRFIDYDNTVLKTEEVLAGDDATAPAENPTREGYTFTGWDTDFTNVQSDLDVYAEYNEDTVVNPVPTYYTVRFIDYDNTVLKTEEVLEGDDATAPSEPSRDGYTFTVWDKDFTNVQSDLDVYAHYEEILDESNGGGDDNNTPVEDDNNGGSNTSEEENKEEEEVPNNPGPTSNPKLKIVKTAVEKEVYVGEDAKFIIVVTNTGDTNLSDVNVIDELAGIDTSIDLDEGESQIFEATVTTTEVGTLTNTATAEGGGASFRRDSASVKVIALEIDDEENPQGNPEPEKDPKDEPEKEETPQNVPATEEPVKKPETEEILDETVPLDLPDTGVLPVEIFYGLGALISGAGVLVSKKK